MDDIDVIQTHQSVAQLDYTVLSYGGKQAVLKFLLKMLEIFSGLFYEDSADSKPIIMKGEALFSTDIRNHIGQWVQIYFEIIRQSLAKA